MALDAVNRRKKKEKKSDPRISKRQVVPVAEARNGKVDEARPTHKKRGGPMQTIDALRKNRVGLGSSCSLLPTQYEQISINPPKKYELLREGGMKQEKKKEAISHRK